MQPCHQLYTNYQICRFHWTETIKNPPSVINIFLWFLLSIYAVDTDQSYRFHFGTNCSKWMVILCLNTSKFSSPMRKFYSNNFATLNRFISNTIRLSSSSSYLNILGTSPIRIFAYSSHSNCQSNDTTRQHCQTHWARQPILDKINLEVFHDLHAQLEREQYQLETGFGTIQQRHINWTLSLVQFLILCVCVYFLYHSVIRRYCCRSNANHSKTIVSVNFDSQSQAANLVNPNELNPIERNLPPTAPQIPRYNTPSQKFE